MAFPSCRRTRTGSPWRASGMQARCTGLRAAPPPGIGRYGAPAWDEGGNGAPPGLGAESGSGLRARSAPFLQDRTQATRLHLVLRGGPRGQAEAATKLQEGIKEGNRAARHSRSGQACTQLVGKCCITEASSLKNGQENRRRL